MEMEPSEHSSQKNTRVDHMSQNAAYGARQTNAILSQNEHNMQRFINSAQSPMAAAQGG